MHSTENYSRLIVLMKQPVSIVVQCSYICTILCSTQRVSTDNTEEFRIS